MFGRMRLLGAQVRRSRKFEAAAQDLESGDDSPLARSGRAYQRRLQMGSRGQSKTDNGGIVHFYIIAIDASIVQHGQVCEGLQSLLRPFRLRSLLHCRIDALLQIPRGLSSEQTLVREGFRQCPLDSSQNICQTVKNYNWRTTRG